MEFIQHISKTQRRFPLRGGGCKTDSRQQADSRNTLLGGLGEEGGSEKAVEHRWALRRDLKDEVC